MNDENIRKAGVELKAFADDLQSKFDVASEKHERTMRRFRFFSHDRANLWRMPRWLWIPLVGSLVLILLAALAAVARGPA
ncbi:MAG: hypothetical protein J0H69_08545 [Burkholderiales bacterium]|jgi:hypothetical protein|nr:hypothetical protein [Burkholderiales bacterium]